MFTVIKALFLRETYTMYGSSIFGYVWTLFREVFSVGIMVVVRLIMGIQFEKGLHIITAFCSNVVIFYAF